MAHRGLSRDFLALHHTHELIKEILRIVWPGRCLGVILHREGLLGLHPYALDGVVVEVAVGDFYLIAVALDGLRAYPESVVLAHDLALARAHIEHRVVDAAMAVVHLVGADV